MAAQPSATRRPTYSSSSSSSSLHPHPIISQPPVSSRVTRPSTSGSSAWVPTFSVSDSQMLNEHTVMSAEGFVAIPKSPTTEAMVNSSTTTISGVMGGGGKEKKEKGKKRAKVFALGKLMVKEVLGGGGNNNSSTATAVVQKEVVVSPKEKKAVHSYGRGGAARPKYKATNLLQPPTPSSAQSVEDSLQAQALRKTLTPLSAPHLPTHRSHSPNYDTLRAGRYPYPPAPATIGPGSTTRYSDHRAVHSPPPPSSVGSASVVSAPHYYGEYHRPSPPHHQYQRPQHQPPEPQQQQQHHHMRRKSSLSLQSATTLTTMSSSGSFTAKTPSTAQTSNWVGSPLLVSSSAQQPYYGGTEAPSSYVVENTSRRRSMSASDIARLAEQDHHQQQQQAYYGKTLPIMQQLAPPSAEQLDSFVPSVHRQASMQELQRTTKPARPRPAALHLGRTSPAPPPTLHVVPDVIIDQGSPSEEESGFASPAPPVVPREPAATKRSSKPLPKGYARGSVAGATEDDTEWVLSESMTVVGFPTTQSSDSFQFDTKEGVKRSVPSVGSVPPPAPVATGGKRESRRGGGVEVMVVKEEWRSERDVDVVEEDGGDGEDEGYTSPDATPRGQRVQPAPAPAAAAVHPSPSPYAPSQQPISRELPIPVVPPPYGAPLPQMQQQQHFHYQHAPLPQMAGLPMHNMNVPQISPLQLAALLPQMGAGMLAPQAAAPPNLLASLLAAQAPTIQQQQQQQQQQQLQQALELYLALANMNLALSAEQMRNAGSDSQ